MKTIQIFSIMLTILSGGWFVHAEGQTNNSTSPAVEIRGGYAPTVTNGSAVFVEPIEFWNDTSKEGTNGWRVQLRIYNRVDYLLRKGVAYPHSTNLMLSVEWGSPVKNSGSGYFVTPNGKFAQFQLLDAKGNVVPLNPRAGSIALGEWGLGSMDYGRGLTYGTHLPEWLSLESRSLVADFPETVSTNVYPRFADTYQMGGEIWSLTNRPPICIRLFKLDEIYCVTNEGDYTLTIQPVLYKQGNHADAAILDRVDLPAVTTKVHLSPVFRKIGDYSVMRGTDGYWKYVNPSEFWQGVWKEDTNGWRVQLRVYPQTNFEFQDGVAYPLSTNLMLSVGWGSAIKNSGDEHYYRTPNGKFAKFELLDVKGNVISPNPNAGTNLLLNLFKGGQNLTYGTNLPAWVSPASGSLVAKFPKTISTNVYPQYQYGGFEGEIGATTNRPPIGVGLLKLDEIYSVTNEGDYTLTVQPVLYKLRFGIGNYEHVLDRVELPSVTTTIHLHPNVK